jgi:broad specificity phosphatase PhoE
LHLEAMAHLLCVRHGESTWNADKRWQGWADAPLSDLGEEQARGAAGRLTGIAFDAVFASDLQRAVRTAELLAPGREIVVEPLVRERDVGDWSGLTTPEIESRWPGQIDAWRAGRIPSPPGGEDNAEFTARVVRGVEHIAARVGDGGVALVVVHGGVVRALERAADEDALTLPNLGGRWFAVTPGAPSPLRAGDIVRLTDPSTPTEAPVF